MCTRYIESQKTSLSCRVSAISAFCRPTTQTPLNNQSLSRYCSHKASCSKLRSKIGCHGNVPQRLWAPFNERFLELIRAHNPNGISIGSAVFAQMIAQYPYTLQWDAPPPPLKIAHSHGEIWTPSNTWFWVHPSPQPKRHLDRFSRFCRAH